MDLLKLFSRIAATTFDDAWLILVPQEQSLPEEASAIETLQEALQSVVARNDSTSLDLPFQEESNICNVTSDLHNGGRESLNIHNDTFGNRSLNDRQDPQGPVRSAPCNAAGSTHHFTPKIMVSNVMSLVPKMSEVSEFILRNQVSLAFITESWLKSSVCDSVIDIPGYSVLRKDRASESHGGICLYLKDTSYKTLDELSCCQDHEVLWVKLRPKRLPRGFSYLIAGVVYHPHWTATENDCMRDHLFQSLLLAESRFLNCALIVAGDFNHLDVKSIQRHFWLKQIVKKPTRKNAILDLVLTNMHDYYADPQHFPPFGLSDHHTVIVEAKVRESSRQSPKFILKRDKRESRRAELGRYFATIDWQLLFSSASGCQDMLDILHNVIHTGLDILMPVKRVRVNKSDVPWMTSHLKSLILKRQKAFRERGAESFCYKFYRNAVNRERKSSKASFYKIKVEHMKAEKKSQVIANTVMQWSSENRVKLNSDKCKELRISFAKIKPQLAPIVVSNQELKCVESAKLLGVTITNNLTWNDHIGQTIKKVSKHMFFLVQF